MSDVNTHMQQSSTPAIAHAHTDIIQPVRIRVEPSVYDDNVCKFIVQQHGATPLYEGAPLYFAVADQAIDAPLPRRLFGILGIERVLIDSDVVTLTKSPAHSWADIAKLVGETIRSHLRSGDPVVHRVIRTQAELEIAVQDVITQEVNPRIASHGGQITLNRVENDIAYVTMSGGCQGCGAAKLTLAHGVEGSIKRAVPQIRKVVDDTDHTAGKTPYYGSETESVDSGTPSTNSAM